MQLTEEQKRAVELSKTAQSLKVNAFAGAGKTSTLVEMAKAMPHERILYVCFNKSIATEAAHKFPRNVECKTVHSLAYGGIVSREPRFKSKLNGRLNGGLIARELNIGPTSVKPLSSAQYGNFILMTINRFLNSSQEEIQYFHLPKKDLEEYEAKSKKEIPSYILEGIYQDAIKIKNRMLNPNDTLYMTHDSYLKLFQLSKPTLSKYSVIMLDEAQDSNGIILSIIENSRARKIFVGDKYQQIYSWRGAVNAMDKLNTEHTTHLTKSFRFGNAVASLASLILSQELQCDQDIVGFEKIDSKICPIDSPDCILFRTNGALISEVLEQVEKKKKVAIVGNVKEMVSLIKGIEELDLTDKSYHAELRDFQNYADFIEYSESDLGKAYSPVLKAIRDFGYEHLIKTLESIESNTEDDCDIVLSTAHKAKGREWPAVKLGGDFSAVSSFGEKKYKLKEENPHINPEEFNLLYVAVTRGQEKVDISSVDYFKHLFAHLDALA